MSGVWKMKMKRYGAKKSWKGKKKACVEAEVMDVELWKEFPEELLEAVIARLPIITLIRFRLVCRKWNSLPKSPHFQQLWLNFALQRHPLLFAVADADIGALYDPSTKEWRYTQKAPPYANPALLCAASDGGLVCYYDHREASFRVGNCLTQTWKELPWPCWTGYDRGVKDVIIGMVTLNQDYSELSAGAGAYKIIWTNSCGNYGVYESMKDAISTGRIPANIKLPCRGFKNRTVSIDTIVYFLTMEPDGIISYDVVNGAWEQFLIPSPPRSGYNSIAECGGRLLMVGKVYDEKSAPFSVCVWELEFNNDNATAFDCLRQ